jgi:hypothetical protein
VPYSLSSGVGQSFLQEISTATKQIITKILLGYKIKVWIWLKKKVLFEKI